MNERQFAVSVVQQLTAAGFEAFWAGGCVRDLLLGIEPSDFDVATSAHPGQVRELFGHRRTLPVGAAFGVIIVLSQDRRHQVEVATFRSDASYSDGRRPDSVTFSTPEMDAQRRDFTINGLFYDPTSERVIDFVSGQSDLAQGIVRAIGDADARIAEDKLRMMRAVRIAAQFGFKIEDQTYQAVQRHAAEAACVSGERLAIELRKSLETDRPAWAVETLRDTGLLGVLLPEIAQRWSEASRAGQCLRMLEYSVRTNWTARLCCALWPFTGPQARDAISSIHSRLKLSNKDAAAMHFSLHNQPILCRASDLPWSQVQPLLVSEFIEDAIQLIEHRTQVGETSCEMVAWLRERLDWSADRLNPPPLVTGQDLQEAGFQAGPKFKMILDQLRCRQLDGLLADRNAALSWVVENWDAGGAGQEGQ